MRTFWRSRPDHIPEADVICRSATGSNAIAHSSFEPVRSFERVENGIRIRCEEGVEFSYIDKDGKMQVPALNQPERQYRNKTQQRKKKGVQKRKKDVVPEDYRPDQSTITYSEFDEYNAEAKELMRVLVEITGHCEPINDGINVVPDIAGIIAASDNVIPFTKPS